LRLFAKRGQITLFIALGIMLLFAVGALIVFKGVGTGYGNFKPYAEEVPVEIQPIKMFVEQCVKDTAKEGLKLIGAQGGYTDLQSLGVMIGPDPTSSEGVEFAPGIYVPYWYYMKSPNSCIGQCFFSQHLTPNNEKIQLQLADYIVKNLQYCTRQFSQFPKFTITDSTPEVETNIGTSNVQVNVLYPLEIVTESRTTKISKFFTILDVNLNKILIAARNIAKIELQYQFLEYNDLELIAAYSDVDKSLLPPFSQTETEMKNVVWTGPDVQKKLQSLFEEKYQLMQAEDALNTVEFAVGADVPYADTINKIYQNMIIPFDSVSGLKVNFHYFSDWPIYLSLNDNSGIVVPDQIMPSFIPGLNMAIERYNTVYDLSHPVVIELEDPNAFKDEGFVFRFAIEANIRGNEPLKFENNPVFALPAESSMLCDINKRNSGDVHLKAVDTLTNKPIEGVNIIFNSIDSCVIGRTDANGELTAQFPVGIGMLSAVHPEYLPISKEGVETEIDVDKEIGVLRLKPLISKKVEGQAIWLNKLGNTHTYTDWVITSTPAFLVDKQSVMVMLERKRVSDGEPEFKRIAIFDKENPSSSIDLVEGEYDMRVMTMYDKQVTIPKDLRCIKVPKGGIGGLTGGKKCQDTWMPGPEDMIMPMPGIEYVTTFTVTREMLKRTSPITFYGLLVNMPGAAGLKIEDIQIINNIANRYLNAVRPKT
jgi:hypothetical protein